MEILIRGTVDEINAFQLNFGDNIVVCEHECCDEETDEDHDLDGSELSEAEQVKLKILNAVSEGLAAALNEIYPPPNRGE